MSYTYDYPRPMVTVDILIFRYVHEKIEILLIQRKTPPFKNQWAFPGGFVNMDERLVVAAQRELSEETSLWDVPLFPLGFADEPDRDPRGRTISFLFGGILSHPHQSPVANDDAGAVRWFSIEDLPELAFDHRSLFDSSFELLKNQMTSRYTMLAFFDSLFRRNDLITCSRAIFSTSEVAETLIEHGLHENILAMKDRDILERLESIPELYRKSLNFMFHP